MYEPNPVKSDRNLAKHGISFDVAERFEWATAVEARDVRLRYPEVRTIAAGLIGGRVHVLAFTRRGSQIRIISLRKANRREVSGYANFQPMG